MNTFSEKLEHQRLKNHFSKEELADKLGVARQTLYNYLAGRNPNWELIQTIQTVFPKISMDYWINDSIAVKDDFVKIDNRIDVSEPKAEYGNSNEFKILNEKLDRVLEILQNK